MLCLYDEKANLVTKNTQQLIGFWKEALPYSRDSDHKPFKTVRLAVEESRRYLGNNIFDGNGEKLNFQTCGQLIEFKEGISLPPRGSLTARYGRGGGILPKTFSQTTLVFILRYLKVMRFLT